ASECLTDAPLEKACHYAGIATLGHGVATELVGRRNPHPTPASKRGASAVGLDEGGIQQPVQGIAYPAQQHPLDDARQEGTRWLRHSMIRFAGRRGIGQQPRRPPVCMAKSRVNVLPPKWHGLYDFVGREQILIWNPQA